MSFFGYISHKKYILNYMLYFYLLIPDSRLYFLSHYPLYIHNIAA